MQDFIGSVRRSFVFRAANGSGGDDTGFGGFVDKIGSSIRKSRLGLLAKPSSPRLSPSPLKENLPPPSPEPHALPPSLSPLQEDVPPFRWRKGELIGSGAFGRVYMGLNLDSGELLAVKQVFLPAKGASKAKTQAHIKELEDEVKLLKNLSHPNIVRYLGTARDAEALNILLEFVAGGSIHHLLEKFESFSESVIKNYTKQLLLGLEYLHKNGIMHRDIKGANILVDNKACIKLADFGASKQVVELATVGAKSMKGTPFWMAPEVIRQTGHSFSADIWSVGCTVIEMATGKPPWVEQHQDACVAAALYHIGSARSPPPIPDNLSGEAKDFLLECFQMEPSSRPSASELLQHPFLAGKCRESISVYHSSTRGSAGRHTRSSDHKSLNSGMRTVSGGLKDICNLDSLDSFKPLQTDFHWDSSYGDNDMCQIDNDIDIRSYKKPNSPLVPSDDINMSFNPICEPHDYTSECKFDVSPEVQKSLSVIPPADSFRFRESSCVIDDDMTVTNEPSGDEDDEDNESKIQAFLNEMASELKKLQTPLYEFYHTLSTPPTSVFTAADSEDAYCNLPIGRSPSPRRYPSKRLSTAINSKRRSPGSSPKPVADILCDKTKARKWREDLDEELETQRERMRHGITSPCMSEHPLSKQGRRLRPNPQVRPIL